MLPKTTPVTIRGDLEQRVTASGYLGASAVPVTPLPPAATPARARTHGRPAPAPARSRSARTQSSTMQASCAIAAAASLASPQTRAGESTWRAPARSCKAARNAVLAVAVSAERMRRSSAAASGWVAC